MNIKNIRDRIIYFRNKKNYSARELSMMIGKHPGYINKLESKDFNLSTNALFEIIDALEIEPEEFFANDYMNYKSNKALFDLISKLPYEKRNSLIDFLNQK